MGVKVGGRFTESRASECWVSRAVQAAIEATTQIAELSSATGTHAFGPSPWTAAATTPRLAAEHHRRGKDRPRAPPLRSFPAVRRGRAPHKYPRPSPYCNGCADASI